MLSISDIETWYPLLLYGAAALMILLLLRYRRSRRRSKKSVDKTATNPAFLPKATVRRVPLNDNKHLEGTRSAEREAAREIFAPRVTIENDSAPCPVHGIPKVECKARH